MSRDRTFDESYVPSPCVRVCTLDDDAVCLGCLRTLDEIKDWGRMAPDEKRALLRALEGRRGRHTGASRGITPRA